MKEADIYTNTEAAEVDIENRIRHMDTLMSDLKGNRLDRGSFLRQFSANLMQTYSEIPV